MGDVMASGSSTRARHALAIVLAWSTVGLIFVGGLVTSTGSGLAVPDWPLSFGQVFPPMVGGIFYEHGHRMVATAVGTLTLVLAIWSWRSERRPLPRQLAFAALGVVIAQGLLGGLTVLLLLPTAISVAHACLAQAFLCVTVALALVTAPDWEITAGRLTDDGSGLPGLTLATALIIYVQLVLGAVMRHTGAGLAIPDFPLALGRVVPPLDDPGVAIHFAHRVVGLTVAALTIWTASRVVRTHPHERALRGPAFVSIALVLTQITLGALTVWTAKAVLPTTAHVACGAALLATCFLLAIRTRHLVGGRTVKGEQPLAAYRVPA